MINRKEYYKVKVKATPNDRICFQGVSLSDHRYLKKSNQKNIKQLKYIIYTYIESKKHDLFKNKKIMMDVCVVYKIIHKLRNFVVLYRCRWE
jgi:hypothetical protein